LDARYLRIPLTAAQRLLQSDRVTNLVVGLDATSNTDRVYDELIPRLNGLPQQMELKRWIDLALFYRQVRTLFVTIFLFLGTIVFFMVVMSSVNTLLMAMFERTREIGTMLAMGTPHSWIVGLFMTEAALLGLLGAAVGIVGGSLAGALLNFLNLHLPPPPGLTSEMPFRVLHMPWLMAAASLLVIISLALASILPAIRASRIQITEALAHV
jgi:putative ABC transport system permease protein